MIQILIHIKNRLYTLFESIKFKEFGSCSIVKPCPDLIVGKKFISIGNHTVLGRHIQLTAWLVNDTPPNISIGSNCQIGSYNHITAANSITICDGVLTGKFVTISDNSHGRPGDEDDVDISAIKRKVFSKGPVIVEENVWIGDKATILPNVRIGRCSIIGANSVVTKDVPPYSVVAGNPAKIIRIIKQ